MVSPEREARRPNAVLTKALHFFLKTTDNFFPSSKTIPHLLY